MSSLDSFTVKGWRQLLQNSSPAAFGDYVAVIILCAASTLWQFGDNIGKEHDPYHHLWFERPQLQNGNDGGATSARKATRNIAQHMKESYKDIVIFWGSQSGTAEGFANRLARELHGRFGQQAFAADLSEFDAYTIAEVSETSLAVFIISTYGEGDPTDNAVGLWNWVQNGETGETLKNLKYAAFGLGNSNYRNYNHAVDVVVQGLTKLGAYSVMPVGKGDDASSTIEEDFMTWKEELLDTLSRQAGFTTQPRSYVPLLSIHEFQGNRADLHLGVPQQPFSVGCLKVINTRELSKSIDRQCLHVEIDLKDDPEIIYKTGDHLAVWPSNPDSEVDRLLHTLGLAENPEVVIEIKSLDPMTAKVPIPSPTTIQAAFRYYLEICGPVSRDMLSVLAEFAPTKGAKSRLLDLSRSENSYTDFSSGRYINIGRLLQDMCPDEKWSAIPLAFLLENISPMQPRYYSISSSSSVTPRRLAITVAVAAGQDQANTARKELVPGVATNYLAALSRHLSSQPNPLCAPTYQLQGPDNRLNKDRIFAHIRKSKFKLPALGSCPLIMVAAGTGLAPFRAFLSERCKLLSVGKPVGPMILFFGCRNPEEDYIYRDELQEMQGILGERLKVVVAFSRVPNQPRRYVQDLISEHADEVLNLLSKESANFYICGRASMAREIRNVVGSIVRKREGWDGAELEEWHKMLRRRNKWQEDVWG